MKKLTSVLLAFFVGISFANAQQRIVEKSFTVNKDESIELDLKFGEEISVKAWDKNEVSFKAIIIINQGKLNDALELDYIQDDMGLRISASYDKEKTKEGRRSDCPDNKYSSYSWGNDDDRYFVCSKIVYEIYVPATADLEVESISSNIELVGLTGPIYAKSISGFVDMSWPERQGAELSLKTISGEAYSDLDDIDFLNKKDHAPVVGYEIKARLRGGGPRVRLESISGNIYLRKSSS